MDFLEDQTAERDRVYAVLTQTKVKYHESCAATELAQHKLDKVEDERLREKVCRLVSCVEFD